MNQPGHLSQQLFQQQQLGSALGGLSAAIKPATLAATIQSCMSLAAKLEAQAHTIKSRMLYASPDEAPNNPGSSVLDALTALEACLSRSCAMLAEVEGSLSAG